MYFVWGLYSGHQPLESPPQHNRAARAGRNRSPWPRLWFNVPCCLQSKSDLREIKCLNMQPTCDRRVLRMCYSNWDINTRYLERRGNYSGLLESHDVLVKCQLNHLQASNILHLPPVAIFVVFANYTKSTFFPTRYVFMLHLQMMHVSHPIQSCLWFPAALNVCENVQIINIAPLARIYIDLNTSTTSTPQQSCWKMSVYTADPVTFSRRTLWLSSLIWYPDERWARGKLVCRKNPVYNGIAETYKYSGREGAK